MGQGNSPVVLACTSKSVRLHSWPIQIQTHCVLAGTLPWPDINPWFFGRVYPASESHFRELRTLAAINHLSCDHITIWYICRSCSFGWSFTSHSLICDQITIWRIWGERLSKTASFMYISYCDMITTQRLNWSQSSEWAKKWNWPKCSGFSAVQYLNMVEPVVIFPVRF